MKTCKYIPIPLKTKNHFRIPLETQSDDPYQPAHDVRMTLHGRWKVKRLNRRRNNVVLYRVPARLYLSKYCWSLGISIVIDVFFHKLNPISTKQKNLTFSSRRIVPTISGQKTTRTIFSGKSSTLIFLIVWMTFAATFFARWRLVLS